MQARRVGKCGDENVHLCGSRPARPWGRSAALRWPTSPPAKCGLGQRQALAAPSAVGVWPCGPPRRLAPLLRGLRLPAAPSLTSGSVPGGPLENRLPSQLAYVTPLLTLLASAPASGISARPLAGPSLLRASSQGRTARLAVRALQTAWRVNEGSERMNLCLAGKSERKHGGR